MDVILAGLALNALLVVLGLFLLYLVIRRAFRDGMLDAWRERPRQAALEEGVARMRRSSEGDGGAAPGV